MAQFFAKEFFIPLFHRFLNQLCAKFPDETKHCQKYWRDPVNKLISWETRLSNDGKTYICNDKGEKLEFLKFAENSDDEILKFMTYFADQFYPFEKELLQVNINMSFFKHKENVLVQHCCLCPVWKVATAKQKQWIWEQLNIMYLIASSLKKVPKQLFVHLRKLLDRVTQTLFKKDLPKRTSKKFENKQSKS